MAKNIRSNKEAAKYCDVSISTISYHLKKGNIKRNKDKSFKIADLNKLKKSKQQKKAKKKKPKTVIEQALEKGYEAKVKLYEVFIERIMNGESLKPSELKHYHALEIELYGQTNGAPKESEILMSNRDAAQFLGTSIRAISDHIKKGNITQNPDGTFYRSILKTQWERRNNKDIISDETKKAQLRYREAKARNEEIELQTKLKKLISAKDVKLAWTKIVTTARVKLTSIKSRVTPIVVENFEDRQSANLCLNEIEKIIEEVLTELASEKII